MGSKFGLSNAKSANYTYKRKPRKDPKLCHVCQINKPTIFYQPNGLKLYRGHSGYCRDCHEREVRAIGTSVIGTSTARRKFKPLSS